MILMRCLCNCIRVDCSSSVCVGSGGRFAMVCAVVLVKGRSRCISVTRPPPPLCCLSCRSVVYPGKRGVVFVCLSLVSWIVAMCILCLCKVCFNSIILFPIPSMFSCRILIVFIVVRRFGVSEVG